MLRRFPAIGAWLRLKTALSLDLLRFWREAITEAIHICSSVTFGYQSAGQEKRHRKTFLLKVFREPPSGWWCIAKSERLDCLVVQPPVVQLLTYSRSCLSCQVFLKIPLCVFVHLQ